MTEQDAKQAAVVAILATMPTEGFSEVAMTLLPLAMERGGFEPPSREAFAQLELALTAYVQVSRD